MKKKAMITAVIGAISLFNISMVAAEVPDNIVLIGEKAFDLDYANDDKNLKEIIEEVTKNSDRIFMKVNDNWFSNKTAKLISNEPSTYFIYKNDLYIVKNNCKVSDLEVKGDLNIEAEGVEISKIKVEKEINIAENVKKVIFKGDYKKVNTLSEEAEIIVESGNIDQIVAEKNCIINIKNNAKIKKLITNGNKITFQGEGKKNIDNIFKTLDEANKAPAVTSGGGFSGGGFTGGGSIVQKSSIEVSVDNEAEEDGIVNVYIKTGNIKDMYGLQIDMEYDPSVLSIEDCKVVEALKDRLNVYSTGENGKKTCAAFLIGDRKGIDVNRNLITIKVKLLNEDKKILNLSGDNSDLKIKFKLVNSKEKAIKIDSVLLGK